MKNLIASIVTATLLVGTLAVSPAAMAAPATSSTAAVGSNLAVSPSMYEIPATLHKVKGGWRVDFKRPKALKQAKYTVTVTKDGLGSGGNVAKNKSTYLIKSSVLDVWPEEHYSKRGKYTVVVIAQGKGIVGFSQELYFRVK